MTQTVWSRFPCLLWAPFHTWYQHLSQVTWSEVGSQVAQLFIHQALWMRLPGPTALGFHTSFPLEEGCHVYAYYHSLPLFSGRNVPWTLLYVHVQAVSYTLLPWSANDPQRKQRKKLQKVAVLISALSAHTPRRALWVYDRSAAQSDDQRIVRCDYQFSAIFK